MNVKKTTEITLQEATTWFVQLDAREVTDKTKSAFFTWLDADNANQQAYIEIEKLWGKLEAVKQLPLDNTPLRGSWFAPFFRAWGPVGAIFSIVVIASLASFLYLQAPTITEVEYFTAIGERVDFRLEDGSLLQLNTNSAVSVRMEKSRRLLTLKQGEAFFDIAPNAQRPLIVHTTGGRVRVLGTRFNIRQTSSGSVVSVIEGLVAVTTQTEADSAAHRDFGTDVTLSANQQTVLIEDQAIDSAVNFESDIVLAWQQGKLIYEGNTLAEVVEDLNRYFPGTIRLDDPSLANLEIVGVLNLRNRTATFAALEATFGVQVVQASENLTLIQAKD